MFEKCTKCVDWVANKLGYMRLSQDLQKQINTLILDSLDKQSKITALTDLVGQFQTRYETDNLVIAALVASLGVEETQLTIPFLAEIEKIGYDVVRDADEQNLTLTLVIPSDDGCGDCGSSCGKCD